MTNRIRIGLLVGLAALGLAAGSAGVLAQSRSNGAASGSYSVPRTPWGDPDLQGIWPSNQMQGTPLERPATFGAAQHAHRRRVRRASEREPHASRGRCRNRGHRPPAAPRRGHGPAVALG